MCLVLLLEQKASSLLLWEETNCGMAINSWPFVRRTRQGYSLSDSLSKHLLLVALVCGCIFTGAVGRHTDTARGVRL